MKTFSVIVVLLALICAFTFAAHAATDEPDNCKVIGKYAVVYTSDIFGKSDVKKAKRVNSFEECLAVADSIFDVGRALYFDKHQEPNSYYVVFPKYAFYSFYDGEVEEKGNIFNKRTQWEY